MTVKKTRRKLPEEDLAAAVADIINSPITRANLAFLNTPPEPAPAEVLPVEQPKPMGHEVKPIGLVGSPMGRDLRPMGIEAKATIPIPELAPAPTSPTPEGDEATPMGFELTPPGTPLPPPYIKGASRARAFWQAENLGTLIESSRVRRISQAQDALSLVEEKVYDLLWGTRNQRRDEFRLVHYSLQRIAAEARINIKTVRELIPRLIEKGFLQVEHEADARRNIPTLYRVASYSAVLADQRRRNRFYVAKTGKGVVYVHLVSASFGLPGETPTPMGFGPPPMGLTPAGLDVKPTGGAPTGPGGLDGTKPMGPSGNPSIGSFSGSKTRQTSSSLASLATLIRCVQEAFGTEPDQALLESIIDACHENALETTGEPATEEELVYFMASKARVISRSPNIRNHLAVLRKAVPECFLGESFRAYRAAALSRRQKQAEDGQKSDPDRLERQREAEEADARYALWARISENHRGEQGYDLQAIAADPELDDLGRQQARRMLERLGRYSRSGL